MPIERPHLGRFGAPLAVCIHVTTTRAEIQPAMHAALAELSTALKAQNITPTGPWFTHHHHRPTETFDFDVCFPVAAELNLSGRLAHTRIPEFGAVRTALHGPYEGLPGAWAEFQSWIGSKGHKIRPDLFEIYSIGPQHNIDSSAWQTDLVAPLANGFPEKERLA